MAGVEEEVVMTMTRKEDKEGNDLTKTHTGKAGRSKRRKRGTKHQTTQTLWRISTTA